MPALRGLPAPENAPSEKFRLQFRDNALIVRWGTANELRIPMEREPDPRAVFRGMMELLLKRQKEREETECSLKVFASPAQTPIQPANPQPVPRPALPTVTPGRTCVAP